MKSLRRGPILALVLAVFAATAIAWFVGFPLKDRFNRSDLIWEGIYLAVALGSYLAILRLDLPLLQLAWPLFSLGLLVDFLDEFTLDKDFFNDVLEDAFNSFGLLLVAIGFHHAYRCRLAELAATRAACERADFERGRLAATLRSIGDAVVAVDLDGRIAVANQAAGHLLGCELDRLHGLELSTASEFRAAADGAPLELVAAILADPRDWVEPRDLRLRALLAPSDAAAHAGRGDRLVELAGRPIRTESGEMGGAILAFRDVGLRRQLERDAVKAGKLESLGLLAGGVAHDFNNILTSILNWSSLPADGDFGGLQPLQEIQEACRRGKRLSTQLMALAKGGEPILAPADLASLIREEARFALRGTGCTLHERIAPGPIFAEVDTGQLGQVVHNLVLNAAQALPGGKVSVSLEHVTGADGAPRVRFAVSDRGEPIPAANLERLFDPYFTTKSGGHGLGLATTYSIVTRHRGTISVRSEAGRGTTFEVLLPASDLAPAGSDSRRGSHAAPSGSGRLLVVDDDRAVREALLANLAAAGFETVGACSGPEAVRSYDEALRGDRRFDAVVMDLTMPGGMSGDEAMRRILEADPDARGVVASGYHDAPVLADHRRHGFRAAITKPYGAEEVIEAVLRARAERQEDAA